MSSYEKQMRWRKAAQQKAEKLRGEMEASSTPDFKPTMHAMRPVKEFDGTARELSDQSRQVYKDRLDKFRVEKKWSESRVYNNARSKPRPIAQVSADTLLVQPQRQQQTVMSPQVPENVTRDDLIMNEASSEQQLSPSLAFALSPNTTTSEGAASAKASGAALSNPRFSSAGNTIESFGNNGVLITNSSSIDRGAAAPEDANWATTDNRRLSPQRAFDLTSLSSESTDEPLIELLERERRQWQDEREKLVQCIHLQQLELTQRSIAAHDRAIDIAKEFARAIEGFEERLVVVESNVQKEIMSIKSIAEALLQATTKQQQLQPKTESS